MSKLPFKLNTKNTVSALSITPFLPFARVDPVDLEMVEAEACTHSIITLAAGPAAEGSVVGQEIELTAPVMARTAGLDAVGGAFFGWLFWRRFLEAAVIAQATVHVVWTALGTLSKDSRPMILRIGRSRGYLGDGPSWYGPARTLTLTIFDAYDPRR